MLCIGMRMVLRTMTKTLQWTILFTSLLLAPLIEKRETIIAEIERFMRSSGHREKPNVGEDVELSFWSLVIK